MNEGLLLVVDRRGVILTVEGGTLIAREGEGAPVRYPLELLGCVVIHGNPLVGCDVWRRLAERGVPAVVLPVRGRGGAAWIGPGLATALRRRRIQHRAEPERVLEVARGVVDRKLAAYGRLLDVLATGEPPLFGRAVPPADGVRTAMERASAALRDAEGVDALMGLEGRAAVAWYGWLKLLLPEAWGFDGRNRRPPRDPFNALLSLGYTLLGAEVRAAVIAAGLDPSLGFLHQPYPGREALVLDCMEGLRPGVDALALSLIDGVVTPESFHHTPTAGCRLGKEGREGFYPAWAAARRRWPQPGSGDSVEASLGAACRREVAALLETLGAGGVEDE